MYLFNNRFYKIEGMALQLHILESEKEMAFQSWGFNHE
jgi:hypothetical protein